MRIPSRERWGQWLQHHHPEHYGPQAADWVFATPDDGCEVHWPEGLLGPAPTAEQIMAWEPPAPALAAVVRAQLDPDEAVRKELLRQLRSSAMAALIANGWTQEQAQEAGMQFVRDYGVDLWVYEFGADKGFFQAVAVDQRSWLSLPLPGHEGQTIRDLFVV